MHTKNAKILLWENKDKIEIFHVCAFEDLKLLQGQFFPEWSIDSTQFLLKPWQSIWEEMNKPALKFEWNAKKQEQPKFWKKNTIEIKGFLAKYKWLNRSIKKQKISIRIKTKIVVKITASSKCSWKLLTLNEREMNCCKSYQKMGNDSSTLMG